MISYHDITVSLNELGLNRSTPVIAHVNLSGMGEVKGGLSTVMGALLATVDNVMMPDFTFSTLIIPESGPEDNAIQYGSGRESNLKVALYSHDLPGDALGSEAGEALRGYPGTFRSSHPVFSFVGLGLDAALAQHEADDPYAPVRVMRDMGGWALLMGAQPSENFSIHFAEQLAGRKQFLRWALTPTGIVEVPHFPGCPNGFNKIFYYLQEELHQERVGEIDWQAVRLDVLIQTALALIRDDAFALLCNDLNCPRCNLVRSAIRQQVANHWQTEN